MTTLSRAKLGLFRLPRLVAVFAAVLGLQATTSGAVADTAQGMLEVCKLADGGGTIENAGVSCCWPGWGCLECATDTQGNIIEGSCRMKCRTAACAEANDTLTPGNPALPPSVKRPESFPGMMTPSKNPQTPKPPKADPGPDTVQ